MARPNTQISQSIPIENKPVGCCVYIQKTQERKMMQEERCNYDEIIMSIIKYDLCERTIRLDWTKIKNQKAAEGIQRSEIKGGKEQPMTATLEESQINGQNETERVTKN